MRTTAAASAGNLQARAAQELIDLEAIRDGGEPEQLTAAQRAKILARLQTAPWEPVGPETAAAILRRLDPAAARQQAAGAYEAGVRDNVHRLIRKNVRAITD